MKILFCALVITLVSCSRSNPKHEEISYDFAGQHYRHIGEAVAIDAASGVGIFKVSAYPTIFVIGPDFKIAQIIPGVPDQLKTILLTTLVKINGKNNKDLK